VWDWNGTLLADQQVVLHALNRLLGAFDRPPTTMATYQRLYTRPVRRFYERLFERPIADAEWGRIDDLFHDAYEEALADATLADDAHAALDLVEGTGRTQSLLSMARHDMLEPLVHRFGLHQRFVLVDGLRGPGGGRKAGELAAHVREVAHVAGDDPHDYLVIGDATDDAEAAAHVGARCVLYDGGSHPREELERQGVPVVDSLVAALDVAGID
jgi:phosphoglycolate phosphatase-like HAD superfamily hydrolase